MSEQFVSHGFCSVCHHEIKCLDTENCGSHKDRGKHYRELECIENLKKELEYFKKKAASRGSYSDFVEEA